MSTLSVNIAHAGSAADVLARVADLEGCALITTGQDGGIVWTQRNIDTEQIRRASSAQLVNRIPGMSTACTKIITHRALTSGCPLPFWPMSWAYSGEHPDTLSDSIFAALPLGSIVIVKPNRSSQGIGIALARGKKELCRALRRIEQSLRDSASTRRHLARITSEAIIQQYIHPPLLLGGFKFDFRVYVLVCPASKKEQHEEELGPTFLCSEGLVRFGTKPYTSPDQASDNWINAHLTNTSLSKVSEDFVLTEDPSDGRNGSKRKLSVVLACLAEDGILSVDAFWNSLEVMTTTVLRRLGSVIYEIAHKPCTRAPALNTDLDCEEHNSIPPTRFGQAFNLIGLDVLLDSQADPVLLEVNSAPSLAIEELLPMDVPLKQSVANINVRKRWAAEQQLGRDWGQRCRCSASVSPHRHEVSLVDWEIKSTVTQGMLRILRAQALGIREDSWADQTSFYSLRKVPTRYL